MSGIPARLRRLAVERANGRCEYCGLAQEGQEATFHIDHVIPVAYGGRTALDNLALACVSCSLRKASRLVAPDPRSGKEVPIFSPRKDSWRRHFHWKGAFVVPLTATGRATVEALRLNRPIIIAIRLEEAAVGRHPPRLP
jgi:hypothetical protein